MNHKSLAGNHASARVMIEARNKQNVIVNSVSCWRVEQSSDGVIANRAGYFGPLAIRVWACHF